MTTHTDDDFLAAFKMPSIDTINGRSSTMSGAFAKALIPVVQPTADEVRRVLTILGIGGGRRNRKTDSGTNELAVGRHIGPNPVLC